LLLPAPEAQSGPSFLATAEPVQDSDAAEPAKEGTQVPAPLGQPERLLVSFTAEPAVPVNDLADAVVEKTVPAAATACAAEAQEPAQIMPFPLPLFASAPATIFQELPVPAKELVSPAAATQCIAEVDTGSMFDSEDGDVDLGRLCAAFRSLEQLQAKNSTPVTCSGQESTGSTSSTTPTPLIIQSRSGQGSPGGVGNSLGGSVWPGRLGLADAPQRSERAAMPVRQAPQSRENQQSADKMDAWFQRVLAKGNDQKIRQSHGTPGISQEASQSNSPSGSSHGGSRAPLSTLGATPPSCAVQEGERKVGPACGATGRVEHVTPSALSDLSFELEVRLSDEVLGTLKFCMGQSIEAACKSFVTQHKLRDMFLAPLETHLELMIHMGKRTDSVDVIDLI